MSSSYIYTSLHFHLHVLGSSELHKLQARVHEFECDALIFLIGGSCLFSRNCTRKDAALLVLVLPSVAARTESVSPDFVELAKVSA